MARDLREYTKNTQVRLIFGFLVLVFLVGDGLIFIYYGKAAGLAGVICTLGILLPVLLVVFLLWIAERVIRNQRQDDD